jgi:hypothetical protein
LSLLYLTYLRVVNFEFLLHIPELTMSQVLVKWTTKLAALKDYKEKNGDVLVPMSYVDEPSGIKLGDWVNNVKNHPGALGNSQRNNLDRLGFVWKVSKAKAKPWRAKLAALLDYTEKNGDALVHQIYVDESRCINLGSWINHLRQHPMVLSDS